MRLSLYSTYFYPILLIALAACTASTWRQDAAVKAAQKSCGNLSGTEQYSCYEREAVARSNPDICRLVGIWIDDMCLQAVYEAADDPSICDRIYLQGVVPNCRAFYAQRTPSARIQSQMPSIPTSTDANLVPHGTQEPMTETPQESPPSPDALTIWGWRLLSFGDETVVDANLSMRLHEDGTLSGSTGCRAFHGAYQAQGEQFEISDLETDEATCTDPAQEELERRYLEALSHVERFWLGEDLVLTTAQEIQLDFMREWVTATPPPGWESYTQAEHGFLFHYPANWQVKELPNDPHRLLLVNGSLTLTIGFRWLEEDASIMHTGVPAGDLEKQDGIEFLGGHISRDVLIYQDKVKAVLYNKGREMEQSNGLIFTLSLDDLTQDPYEAVDIPPAAQLQIDWVLRTFQWLPQAEQTPAYSTPSPWPVADPLQVILKPYAQIGRGYVQAIQWLADSRTLVLGTSLGVRLIDTKTGQEKAFLDTDKAVWGMKVSPDGRTAAVTQLGGGDYIYPPGLWDLQTGELLTELPDVTGWDSVGIGGMAFSPDGELLGTLDMEVMSVWATRTGRLLYSLRRTGGVLAFSPDGSQLLTNEGSSLIVWDLATETELQRFVTHAGDISRLALSADGRTIAILGQDVRLIAAQNGQELAILEESQGSLGEIVFSTDGSKVAVGGKVWDAATGRLARSLEIGDDYYPPLFSPDLHFAAALPLLRDPDAVYLWDGPSGELRGPIFESKLIGSFNFSPDSALLALANLARRIELWDIGAQRYLDRSFAPASTELGNPVFNPDGSLVVASDGSGILLWETALGGEPRRLIGHTEPVYCLAFARDDVTLFSGGSDNRLLQWDLQTGQLLRSLEGLRTDVVALAVSPDGDLLVSGSNSVEYDRQGENPAYEHQPIRIWDAHTGELLRGFNYADVLSLEFGPDGSWLAAQLTIGPGLIDVLTGHHIQSLPNEGYPFVANVAVHPGGRLLAMGVGRDILLWDVAARQIVMSLKGNQNQLYRVAFSPDGRFLATGGEDYVLRLWRMEIP